MANGKPTSPEVIGQIKALTRRGMGTRAIARELDMPVSTVSSVVRNVLMVVQPKKEPSGKKKKAPTLNKDAPEDKSKAKVTRIDLPTDYGRVCNAASRDVYVPTELNYRGRV